MHTVCIHPLCYKAPKYLATKRPRITLKELQSSTVEIGVSVHRTTLSRTLHRAGLYRRVARNKLLLKENTFGVRQKACERLLKNMEESTLVR